MTSRKDIGLYIPEDQTATIYFTKQGPVDPESGKPTEVPVMWMEVKADLTFDDRKSLFWDEDELEDLLGEDGKPVLADDGKVAKQPLPIERVYDRLAPFVLDWSVGRKGEDGKPERVDPPSVGGPGQLALIHEAYVWELLRDLRFRSTGKVSTDFLPK